LFARSPALSHYTQIPGLAMLERNSACTSLLAVRRMLPRRKTIRGSSLYKSNSERARTSVRGDNPSELAAIDKGNTADFHKPYQKAGGNLSIVRFGNG
jgi:hypothetical protein